MVVLEEEQGLNGKYRLMTINLRRHQSYRATEVTDKSVYNNARAKEGTKPRAKGRIIPTPLTQTLYSSNIPEIQSFVPYARLCQSTDIIDEP
jgi:hypothetical protein